MRGCYPEKQMGMRAFFSSLQPQSHVEQRLVQHVGLGAVPDRRAASDRSGSASESTRVATSSWASLIFLCTSSSARWLASARAPSWAAVTAPVASRHRPTSCAIAPKRTIACSCARACCMTALGRAQRAESQQGFPRRFLRYEPISRFGPGPP